MGWAEEGEAAWEILKRDPFRVVISDWQMPRLDGLGLCQRIRQRAGEYVYFILLTQMVATEKNLQASAYAGVDDFLEKPVNPEQLWMRLRVAERILGFTTKVQQLESFLPICGYCKKIRDDKKYWQEIEAYFGRQQGTKFSHSVCPDCYQREIVPQLRALGVDPTMLKDAAGPQA